jgi:hypothetical protein
MAPLNRTGNKFVTGNAETWTFTGENGNRIHVMRVKYLSVFKGKSRRDRIINKIARKVEIHNLLRDFEDELLECLR